MRLQSQEVSLVRNKWDFREILQKNAVTVMFVVLCLIGLVCSGQTVSYVMYELFGRLSRNSFIVLALIIPIIAGMGINFAITIGAMAAQIAALWVIEWGISGLAGFLTAMVITMPIAAFFGFLIGKLMNKMKGQEMIGGLILGYFANGLYQLLFLFIFGNLIPLKTPGLVIKGSTGVANTIDLSTERGFKYALDGLWRVPFGTAALILCGLIAIWSLVKLATKKEDKKKALTRTGICVAVAVIAQLPFVTAAFSMVSVPMVTFLIVALLCVFNNAIMKTRIGQQFRMGSFQTYGAHEQVGLYAGAAILVGGASIKKATNGQALLGCILFHLLFIVAPSAGKNLFGDAAIGEYFRVFISYGVIALALVMYAWGDNKKKKAK